MKLSPFQIFALGGVAIVGFLVFRASRAGARALQAINPLNNQNVISEGFNELTGASDRGSSLGSDIFDFVQGLRGIPEFDPNAPPGAPGVIDLEGLRTLPPTVFAPEVPQMGKEPRRVFVPPSFDRQRLLSLPPIQGSLL